MAHLVSFLLITFMMHQSESIKNPVLNRTGMLVGLSLTKEGDTYHMLTMDSQSPDETSQPRVQSTKDFETWSEASDMIFELPNTTLADEPRMTISPNLHIINGTFLLYFMTSWEEMCLGVASADKANGPYELENDALVCGTGQAYTRFPHILVKSGQRTLFYSSGMVEPKSGGIKAVNLSEDGLSTEGKHFSVSGAWSNDEYWNPRVIKINNYFYLFFSIRGEGIFVTRSLEAFGPYEKLDEKPFIAQSNGTMRRSFLSLSSIVKDSNDMYAFLLGTQMNSYFSVDVKKFKIKSGWPLLID